ncbi:hypothetical protein BC826DRAFT_970077 [Russula brevipes]|nr:hypothetical protein BC826DRAFT_970077 [Russula brevipes]
MAQMKGALLTLGNVQFVWSSGPLERFVCPMDVHTCEQASSTETSHRRTRQLNLAWYVGSVAVKALKDVRVRTTAKNRGEDEEVETEQEKTSSQGRRRLIQSSRREPFREQRVQRRYFVMGPQEVLYVENRVTGSEHEIEWAAARMGKQALMTWGSRGMAQDNQETPGQGRGST